MHRYVSSLLAFSVIVGPVTLSTHADGPTPIRTSPSAKVQLKNVELSATGQLSGQYLDAAGNPLVDSVVVIAVGDAAHNVKTDEKGRFVVGNLTGGRCVIRVGKEVFACQLWVAGTAPPKSLNSIAVVRTGSEVVRGNFLHTLNPMNGLPLGMGALSALGPKAILGLGLAAGGIVAISVGANNDDDDAS